MTNRVRAATQFKRRTSVAQDGAVQQRLVGSPQRRRTHPATADAESRSRLPGSASEGEPGRFAGGDSENGGARPEGMLEHEICYRAMHSRDRRFDGRFFIGVVTTGVYCRPICPAPTPQRQNVQFFACAAGAQGAGFRPCRRCRPEAAPGTPAWMGTSTTVSRALREIGAGVLDEISVAQLADRVGIGDRHLRRLFLQHLGVSPNAIAQTHRLHFAKRLIDQTALPMTRIAFESGYSSVRRFNAAMQGAFAESPTAMRRRRHKRPASRGSLQLQIPFRPPFRWSDLISYLAPRAAPGVESFESAVYRRAVRIGESTGIIEVRPAKDDSCLLIGLPASMSGGLVALVERVRRLFDLSAAPTEIDEQLRHDPLLSDLVRDHPGVRVPGAWDGFELAVRAILGQQVTVTGATTLMGRLVEGFGEPLSQPENGVTHFFPAASVLAQADVRRIGIPRARAETVRALAEAVQSGTISLQSSAGLEQAVKALTRLPGIGEWTAHYIAMRALGEPDAFPASDLGLRRALATNGTRPSPADMTKRAEVWRPWRAYAAMRLWVGEGESATRNRSE